LPDGSKLMKKRLRDPTELDSFDKIKKLAVIAMVSDDELMDQLVLKGGNAIDLIYGLSGRASTDIDFSMERQFDADQLGSISEKIERLLKDTFASSGLTAFDVKLSPQPPVINGAQRTFWGGYKVEFKVIPSDVYIDNVQDIKFLQRNASVIGPQDKRVFVIDISRFEYCTGKAKRDLDGYTVYVYTPEMIVIEKVRAICQQVPEYRKIVKKHPETARARDFFDIYILMEHFPIDLNEPSNKLLIKKMFESKRVPLSFIKKVEGHKEFHRPDFDAVRDTVKGNVKLKGFDYYFDYVVSKLKSIKF